MSEKSVFELVENWGYHLLAKSHPDSLGYDKLLVAIRKQSTGQHFDPQRLHLRIRDEHGLARWITSSWLSPHKGSSHVCPGLITLHDRLDKQVYFFAFGGALEAIIHGADEMVYELRSPAPILELTSHDETVQDQLASETSVLLGEIEVKWRADEKGFSRRLAQVDPLQFYLATLQSLLHRYEHTHALEDTYHKLHDALCREREWFVAKGQWPAKSTVLEDLLAPA